MSIEDVGVVCAVHHLVAVVVVLVAAATVRAVSLGTMAVSGHPVTCVTHGNQLLMAAWKQTTTTTMLLGLISNAG